MSGQWRMRIRTKSSGSLLGALSRPASSTLEDMKRRGGARKMGWRARARREAIAAIEDMVAAGVRGNGVRGQERGGVGDS